MPDQDLRQLADEYWDVVMEASPTSATLLGDHRFDDRIEDLSADGEARLRARLTSLRERLAADGEAGLEGDDVVTYHQLVGELDDAVSAVDHRLVELSSDQMTGFHVELLLATPLLSAPDAGSATMLLERLRQVPRALDQVAQRFLEGAERGRTPAAICVSRAVNIIDGYLASPLEDDVFVRIAGPAGWDGEAGWRSSLADVTRDVVRPAYRRLADTLRERLLPLGRDDEHCGLSWLADGPELYAVLAAHHTTVDRPPEEVHQVGMEEVTEKLPAEFAEVGGRLFGLTEAPDVLERLRRDPGLRYATGEEIMVDVRRALEAATAVVAEWFGRLPQAACAIEPVPAFLAADAPAAYYFPPAADGSRGGTYYVNTDRASKTGRHETAAIAFHEAIPGHHLQLAIASELTDLPRFRRFSLGNTAYVEGWGLYSERLAEEMGLYRNDLERIGMLAADSLRACRLVVDTGLHTLGWSRARAIDFMATHTPISIEEVTVEVDRYIGMPAQALAYKLGQREIFRLREDARSRLDGRFDIKGFHDTVLGSGAVRLPVLAQLVEGWSASSEA